MTGSRFAGAAFLCALGFVSAQDNSPAPHSASKGDRQLTYLIRRSIVDDKSLSASAHTVKIISQNGTVTLRGAVANEDEKATLEAKAKAIAGVSAVNSELTVAAKSK